MEIKISIKEIIFFLAKKSFLILILGFIFVVGIFMFMYWKYVESLTELNFKEIEVKSELEKNKLEFLKDDIENRKDSYQNSLQAEYNNPFERNLD